VRGFLLLVVWPRIVCRRAAKFLIKAQCVCLNYRQRSLRDKHSGRAESTRVVTVPGMTHTLPPPNPENLSFLEALGWHLAERATSAMHRDLTDAFILMHSMDTAAPSPTLPDQPDMEQNHEDQVQ
jgi:hypothetical protein